MAVASFGELPPDLLRAVGLLVLESSDDARDFVRWCATCAAARGALLPEVRDFARRAEEPDAPPRSDWILRRYWGPLRDEVRRVVAEDCATGKVGMNWIIGDRVGGVRALVDAELQRHGGFRRVAPGDSDFPALHSPKPWWRDTYELWLDTAHANMHHMKIKHVVVVPGFRPDDASTSEFEMLVLFGMYAPRLQVLLVSESQVPFDTDDPDDYTRFPARVDRVVCTRGAVRVSRHTNSGVLNNRYRSLPFVPRFRHETLPYS